MKSSSTGAVVVIMIAPRYSTQNTPLQHHFSPQKTPFRPTLLLDGQRALPERRRRSDTICPDIF
ncbi:MAG: hypothetical protein HC899_39920 [Leptolyngbyaceae cyanobacterium SM1_4_3]|nr:hypothetical protein [Leptolyngbyaceae cyanobacterium SM1_4_3]